MSSHNFTVSCNHWGELDIECAKCGYVYDPPEAMGFSAIALDAIIAVCEAHECP